MPKTVQKLILPLIATALAAAVWLGCVADWSWFKQLPPAAHLGATLLGVLVAGAWLIWTRWPERKSQFATAVVASLAFLVFWQASVAVTHALVWDVARAYFARCGLAGTFLIGLMWVVYGIEKASQKFERARRERIIQHGPEAITALAIDQPVAAEAAEGDIWHPLDPDAWYYGRPNRRKLNQSLSGLLSYSVAFALVCLLLSQVGGCREIYEMPAGGGKEKAVQQKVKIQKIIRKKFVVNPYSAVLFKVPPIDEVRLQLEEITEHAYQVGYGEGKGAGFRGGTARGKVRFIRLQYSGGDWDQDFGIGGDLNMLIEYGARTGQKVESKTESRFVSDLKNFPPMKSPPFVYMTGQKNISFSNSEVKTMREYLLEKHGFLFCDNGGSRQFHSQFLALMNRVLPEVRPSTIPADDLIHKIQYGVPSLPYVAPHGGDQPLGWRVDGRLVCYYHPGDIGDAWADGHAGVSPEIYEACYQLGTNIIFYAHQEYSKWLEAQEKN